MKRVLISNIGNRNIQYKGSTYFDFSKIKKDHPDFVDFFKSSEESHTTLSFKNFTQYLLMNFEREKKYVIPNIIQTLIEEKKETIQHVILYSSNQVNQNRQDQDTLYEGELLVKLLSEIYPTIHFENKVLTCAVTHNDALLETYRGEIGDLLERFPNQPFYLCDAGGTAQQKSALKIMFEYMVEKADFEVYYVSKGEGDMSSVEKVEQIEYRKVIDGEQIRILIQHLQYQAAYNLYTHADKSAGNSLVGKLLMFGHFRTQKLIHDAKRYIPDSVAELKDFSNMTPIAPYPTWMHEIIDRQTHFRLCELLSLVQIYLYIENYTFAVLTLSQFIESYVNAVLEVKFQYSHNYEEAKRQIVIGAKLEYPNVAAHFPGNRNVIDGIPTRILIAENCENSAHLDFIHHFKGLYSHLNAHLQREYSLDRLRNAAAHEGKGVSKSAFFRVYHIEEVLTDFYRWLNLPSENVYIQLNHGIKNALIQS